MGVGADDDDAAAVTEERGVLADFERLPFGTAGVHSAVGMGLCEERQAF